VLPVRDENGLDTQREGLGASDRISR